jgi:hypothetical protein
MNLWANPMISPRQHSEPISVAEPYTCHTCGKTIHNGEGFAVVSNPPILPSARQVVRDKRWNTQDGLGVFQDDPVLEERLSQHDR